MSTHAGDTSVRPPRAAAILTRVRPSVRPDRCFMSVPQDLPFWQVNVPEHLRRDQCPDYLVGLSDKDRRHLSTPDSEFRVHSWPEVRDLVQSGRLDLFRRWPSELHRYRAFMYQLQHQHGSVAQFLLRERLGWEVPVRAQGTMFQNPEDTKILFNDWPYAVDPRIVHLVVWTKFPIEQDPATGILTARARRDVDRFVSAVFSPRVPREQVSLPCCLASSPPGWRC